LTFGKKSKKRWPLTGPRLGRNKKIGRGNMNKDEVAEIIETEAGDDLVEELLKAFARIKALDSLHALLTEDDNKQKEDGARQHE
jgi:hypothetical protein